MAPDATRRRGRGRRRKAGSLAAAPSSALFGALRGVTADLRRLRQSAALVGGLAVSAVSEPRLTRDIDLALSVGDDQDAEVLVHRLQGKGYLILAALEQERTRRLATVRLAPPGPSRVVIDLLFASSGIEREVVAEAVPLDLAPRLTLPVARIGHLLALKVLARDDRRRPQDYDDIRALLDKADRQELECTERALSLITERGFNRGKNLSASWKKALRLK